MDYIEFASDDTLGGRISYARSAARLTMAQAARRLGVETVSWRNWECDRSTPRANRLTMMAGFLGVSPAWLLAGMGTGPSGSISTADDDTLLANLEFAEIEAACALKRLRNVIGRMGSSNQADDKFGNLMTTIERRTNW